MVVCGPIWSKFENLVDVMHVLNTFKFKIDQINSNREKVATSFLDALGQRIVVRGWIWPNFKLIQALMYIIITCAMVHKY